MMMMSAVTLVVQGCSSSLAFPPLTMTCLTLSTNTAAAADDRDERPSDRDGGWVLNLLVLSGS